MTHHKIAQAKKLVPKSSTHFKVGTTGHRIVRACFVIAIAALGVYFLSSSHAQSPYASSEAESGTLANGAATVADSNASGGSAIKFSSGSNGNAPGIYVSGNKLVNGQGATITLHGVDRSGTEYMCQSGGGIFDGPSDQTSINAMLSWHVNAVRIPLNSACWLDTKAQIASYNSADTGTNYQNAITNFVNLLNQNGIYAILDLHWTGCGTAAGSCDANSQQELPDRPYATQFWSSVGAKFKDNHSVLFDLFNEPTNGSSNWTCWENGGCTGNSGTGNAFTEEGMQEMLTAVRSAGATTQPIMMGGLHYSNDMTQWLSHEPTDPDNSEVASVHLYQTSYPCPWSISNGAGTAAQAESCLSSGTFSIAAIAAKVPVVFGELGETDCNDTYVNALMGWMDTNHYSYLGWSWNTSNCASFPSLVSNYNGTATAFGAGFQQHMTATFPATGPIQ